MGLCGNLALNCVSTPYTIIVVVIFEYNIILHSVRKYARIFVHGHYLFREVNSVPRAKLEENCEL